MAYEQKEEELSEDIKTCLKNLTDHFYMEDKAVRERQIRTWRRLKLYWDGFTRIWFSETAHDWRVWDFTQTDDVYSDSYYYDKTANIFKAYLESIIAALSINIPSVRCIPDDADNPLDVMTAKGGNRIAELLYKHNNASMLWLHALYIYCTEGLIAAYTYPKEDRAYGTTKMPQYEEYETEGYACSFCGTQLSDELFSEREVNEYMPDTDDVMLHDAIENDGEIVCPECAEIIDPNLQKTKLVVERQVGVTDNPKTRQCVEIYGGLYVKVPNYAMRQADIPYLMFCYETHYSNALEMYPHLREKLIGPNKSAPGNSGIYDPYERWGRLSTQYYGEYPVNNVTVRNCWYRPSSYHTLGDEDKIKELKSKYPDGVKVVFVDECFAHACNESLDDCWTLSYNPLSDYLHHDPLGSLLTSIQDLVNDLISLIIQSIEHGIPQTAVDPAVVDLNAYRQMEITPGGLFPTKNVPANKNISESFYTFTASSLSEQVLPALQQFQQLGQLASGALPSLFGGIAEAGSKTASEYSMSRAQALQRLQNSWKSLSIFWKDTFAKSILSYIKEMSTDERLVEKDKQGNYINTFIRKAEMQGKIGEVELESSENLPVSWAQVKDVIMKIMEMNNPEILQALFDPENIPYVKEALGLNQFKLPGEDSRQKQYEEIQQLLNSEPIELPPPPEVAMAAMQMGMPPPPPQEVPSVEVDVELDEHPIEAEICRKFLISEQGRLAKIKNDKGYYNVLLHFKAHMQAMMPPPMPVQQSGQEEAKGEVPPPKVNKSNGAENGIRTPVQ
jgi:hypothetical protein